MVEHLFRNEPRRIAWDHSSRHLLFQKHNHQSNLLAIDCYQTFVGRNQERSFQEIDTLDQIIQPDHLPLDRYLVRQLISLNLLDNLP